MATPRRSSPPRQADSPVAVGLIVLAVIAVGVYLGFTKDIPFTQGFQVKAVFESANSIRPNSPVRIAGVNVGKVKKIEPHEDTDAAVVRWRSQAGAADPQGRDGEDPAAHLPRGQLLRRPRAGHAGRAELDDGDTIPVTQTSTPVQLDQVLTALQNDTREDLKTCSTVWRRAQRRAARRRATATPHPSARGETAASRSTTPTTTPGRRRCTARSTRRSSAPSRATSRA